VVPATLQDAELIASSHLHHKGERECSTVLRTDSFSPFIGTGRTIALCWQHPASRAALLRRSYEPQSPDSPQEVGPPPPSFCNCLISPPYKDLILDHVWKMNPGVASRKMKSLDLPLSPPLLSRQ